jgi:predicted restriction endonuclease
MWTDDITIALKNLDGFGNLKQINGELEKIRLNDLSPKWKAVVRRTIQQNSSDTTSWNKKNDFYYSVNGIGKGVWGLRNYFPKNNIIASKDHIIYNNEPTKRAEYVFQRIIRDSYITSQLKKFHDNTCQICNHRIEISKGKFYSEGHHIKPLGIPHNGPDIPSNILILCPNCHILCDYKSIKIYLSRLKNKTRFIMQEFIDYHNDLVK